MISLKPNKKELDNRKTKEEPRKFGDKCLIQEGKSEQMFIRNLSHQQKPKITRKVSERNAITINIITELEREDIYGKEMAHWQNTRRWQKPQKEGGTQTSTAKTKSYRKQEKGYGNNDKLKTLQST